MKSPHSLRFGVAVVAIAVALSLTSVPLLAQDAVAGLADRLRGTWSSAATNQLLRFDGDRCVVAHHLQQTLMRVRYDDDRGSISRQLLGHDGPASTSAISFVDETHATLKGKHGTLELVRVAGPGDEVPAAVATSPLALGDRALEAGERERIAAELAKRCEREQDVRRRLSAVEQQVRRRMAEKGEQGSAFQSAEVQAVIGEMSTIDRDNTRWMRDLLVDVGWIDAARFGDEANRSAFLIVQHCGNVRMLQPVVKALQADGERGHAESLARFALMHDRLSLSMGGEQRYGSQLHGRPDGSMYFPRLEDPANVDARRKGVGLGSLAEYAARFADDGKVELPAGYDKQF